MRRLTEADLAGLPDTIGFTVDVEQHGDSDVVRTTRWLLDLLERHEARGTFFVAGEVAERAPALVREIATRGHEVASHSWRHLALWQEPRAAFAGALRRHRRQLEDLAGAPVQGFRAPFFSLGPATAWAIHDIGEAGFRYSSSVLPGRAFGVGWPQAPEQAFRWPNGLVELPCPIGRMGPFRWPFLGGMYLRYLPDWWIRRSARQSRGNVVWSYCHPYDIDVVAAYRTLPEFGAVASRFLWWNRASMVDRLRLLASTRACIPLHRHPVLQGELPEFSALPSATSDKARSDTAGSPSRPTAGVEVAR